MWCNNSHNCKCKQIWQIHLLLNILLWFSIDWAIQNELVKCLQYNYIHWLYTYIITTHSVQPVYLYSASNDHNATLLCLKVLFIISQILSSSAKRRARTIMFFAQYINNETTSFNIIFKETVSAICWLACPYKAFVWCSIVPGLL